MLLYSVPIITGYQMKASALMPTKNLRMIKMNLLKIFLFCILLVYCFSSIESNAQVTNNAFMRVLNIHVGKNTGTAFTLDVDGRQYLITAKHMIADLKQEDSIDIYTNNEWAPLAVKVLKCEEPIDIAVLIPTKVLTISYPLEPGKSIYTGQEVYFLGFPYGLLGPVNWKNVSGDYPDPFVKKGFVSSFSKVGEGTLLMIDGFNNPGFSGGPIVYRDINQVNNLSAPLYVAGVISGFRPELLPVMIPQKIMAGDDISKVEQWRIVQLQDGQKAILRNTGQVVAANTGIVIGYGIKHAVDLIKKNPIGPKIAQ